MSPCPAARPRRRVTPLLSLAATSAALAPQAADAAPGDPLGAPIPVASGIAGGHVARAGNGRMVVSYLSGGTLKARRYAADGSPDGAPITVASAAAITSAGASMDADGDFVVAWADRVDQRWQLRARRYGADGAPRDGVIEVGTVGDQDPRIGSLLSVRRDLNTLAVDMNPDGDFTVLWGDSQATVVGNPFACKYLIGAVCAGDTRETLRLRRYDRSGRPKAAASIVASAAENSLDIGGIAGLSGGRVIDGADVETRADGSVIAAWTVFGQFGELQRGRLYTRHYAAGGSAGLAREVGTAGRAYRADLRLDSALDGSYALVHRTVDVSPETGLVDCGVELDRLAADGSPVQPRVRLDLPAFDFDCLSAPDIAMDALGNHVVAFLEQGGIRARRYAAGGTALAGSFDVTPPASAASRPTVASDAAGNFVVGYSRSADGMFVLQRYEGP